MAKKDKQKHQNTAVQTVPAAAEQQAAAGSLPKMKRKPYEREMARLHGELVAMQEWVKATGAKICIVFEGRDTAGKGGTIKRITERVSPRVFRVVALPAPTPREKSQMYLQRYVEHFPAAGEVILFDRSWYNRAGVEKVMGFCTPEETASFLRAAPEFERQFTDDGILLYKYWLCCDQEVQEERFENRLNNPMKRWKLSPIDIEARKHYENYTDAREHMLRATNTEYAPWTLVDFNDQKIGRLTLLRDLLDKVPDTELPRDDIPWPPLPHEPLKERYSVLEPISPYPIAKQKHHHGHHHHHEHEH